MFYRCLFDVIFINSHGYSSVYNNKLHNFPLTFSRNLIHSPLAHVLTFTVLGTYLNLLKAINVQLLH